MIKQEAISAHLAWADIRALPFKNETFNTIICISTLEHIKELVQALNDIKRILKPRGKLLAGFPAQNFFTDRLLGGSTEFHVSSHKTILQAAEKVFSIIKVKHFPFIFPMNYSFYCAFAGRKI
jgi:ubiquinone/menaquinone biosynthesis C-methylase UbiE